MHAYTYLFLSYFFHLYHIFLSLSLSFECTIFFIVSKNVAVYNLLSERTKRNQVYNVVPSDLNYHLKRHHLAGSLKVEKKKKIISIPITHFVRKSIFAEQGRTIASKLW